MVVLIEQFVVVAVADDGRPFEVAFVVVVVVLTLAAVAAASFRIAAVFVAVVFAVVVVGYCLASQIFDRSDF